MPLGIRKRGRSPPGSSGPNARHALAVIAGGALVGIATLVASSFFAALIFSGPLAPHLTRGIGIALFTALVADLLGSLLQLHRLHQLPAAAAPALAAMSCHRLGFQSVRAALPARASTAHLLYSAK